MASWWKFNDIDMNELEWTYDDMIVQSQQLIFKYDLLLVFSCVDSTDGSSVLRVLWNMIEIFLIGNS